ncbi:hypothetical protein, partial [Gemmiger sp.]|uniref:hypothetical protein n=1 Tax=Gemmiger sp. TaxID=2049027 RepID=UPI003AB73497
LLYHRYAHYAKGVLSNFCKKNALTKIRVSSALSLQRRNKSKQKQRLPKRTSAAFISNYSDEIRRAR